MYHGDGLRIPTSKVSWRSGHSQSYLNAVYIQEDQRRPNEELPEYRICRISGSDDSEFITCEP